MSHRHPFAALSAASFALAVLTIVTLIVREAPVPAARAQELGAVNDNFERRIFLGPVDDVQDTFPFDLTQSSAGATLEQGEAAPCANIGASVWFEYYPDREGTLEVSTAGSNFDTVLTAYTWGGTSFLPSPPGGAIAPITCNDNVDGTAQSRVSVPFSRSSTVLIQVAGRDGATGTLKIHADCNPLCRPINDDLVSPGYFGVDAYTPAISRIIRTTAASLEPGEERPCGDIGATVWWTFYADREDTLEIDTFGSNFDTVLALYERDVNTGAPNFLSCDDNTQGSQSKLTISMTRGREYLLQAGGASGATGMLKMSARCVPGCRPSADNIGDWYTEPPLEYSEFTTSATMQPDEPRRCGGIGKTVWLGVQVQGNARITLDAGASDFPVVAAVYQGDAAFSPPGGLSLIDCVARRGDAQPRITWDAEAGVTYWIQAGGRDGASGQLNMTVSCDPDPCPPYNDTHTYPDCCIGVPFTLPYHTVYDNRGATTEPDEPLDCGGMSKTVWVTAYGDVAGTRTHPFTIDTAGTRFPTAIAVYEAPSDGAPFSEMRRVACGVSDGATPARVQLEAPPQKRFYVQIGGRDGASGEELFVNADCVGPCPPGNDSAFTPNNLAPGDRPEVNTLGATMEAGEQTPCGNIGRSVWFIMDRNLGDMRLSTEGSDFRTVIAVYTLEGMTSPPGGVRNLTCTTEPVTVVRTNDERSGFLVQVGGVDRAGGLLKLSADCVNTCPVGVPSQPGLGGFPAGSIGGPDTGSGGYLPGAR